MADFTRPESLRRRRLLSAGLGMGLSASGCGFKLRGALPMPFTTLYSASAAASVLGAELRRAVRAHGVTVVEQRAAAEVRVDILQELNEREISALSTAGRPREFQLRLRLRWQALDAWERPWVPATEWVAHRTVTVLDTQGIANPDEEALLYRDMRQDAVQQIIRRLAALRPLPAPLPTRRAPASEEPS